MNLLRFALACLLSAPSFAQCLVPDNLDLVGAACSGTVTQLSQRAFAQPALGICWKDCGLDAQSNYVAVWGALNPVIAPFPVPPMASCGWYRARLRLYNGSGQQWDGQMYLAYSRTWVESPAPGQIVQVWRYLVNGDMQPLTPSALACGVPPCAAPNGNLVRFTGYVDYAFDCQTSVTQRAWMITHACDAIDHVAGYPRAGSYHPDRFYTFVGPSSGFVVGAGGTLEAGATTSECLRKWDALALPARCTTEDPLLSGSISPNTMTCMCGVGPANWYEGTLFAACAFGSSIVPFPGSAPFRSYPIGMWTTPGVFPGVEEVRWNCNEGMYTDCPGVSRQEFYFGATTAGGWQAFSFPSSTPPVPLPLTFVDQSNSMILPANVPTRNRPYRSDHILNLNF